MLDIKVKWLISHEKVFKSYVNHHGTHFHNYSLVNYYITFIPALLFARVIFSGQKQLTAP